MDTKSIEQRANEWALSGDTGLSSEAIARKMLGIKGNDRWNYPHDDGDLGRCVRLLDRIPEWRERIGEMASVSPMWAALVKHWDELERLHRAGGKGVYDRISALVNSLEDKQPGFVRLGKGISLRVGR